MLGTISANYVSPTGKYVMWYDSKAKHYFAWTGDSIRNISKKIKAPLWNEEHDSPSDPPPYGLMSWHENDSLVYIYDRYDIWAVDPVAKMQPRNLSVVGRTGKKSFRYLKLDNEERFVRTGQRLYLRNMDQKTKASGISELDLLPSNQLFTSLIYGDYALGNISKAKESSFLLYNKETYTASPDLYINPGKVEVQGSGSKAKRVENELKLSSLNPQQSNYYWGTSELYKWKAFDGKPAEGILYKPENFDPKKKYPVIFYFYETHTNTLHDYIDPTPTGSRLNISFFVSRGYLVFSPDIRYKVGYPAKSAYNYVVSAAKDLAKKPWVDGKNMGIQGQSWGGIQVAQLITMTDIFKAAWAGAPVANMTSAYGGIRWESGANRQFQYEKTQRRIGATLWQKPQLYIENSPLFHLPKVKTPLVIMANDADGAVPWYQGIELFTAMRRLGKKVWMLNYNGEAHNLVERKNKKDIQVREQQYFDWLLKGEKPPKWIVDGIPAVKKGRDWGLELID